MKIITRVLREGLIFWRIESLKSSLGMLRSLFWQTLPSTRVSVEKLGYSHVVLGYSTALTQQDVRAQIREVSSFAVNDWCITGTALLRHPCEQISLQPLLKNITDRIFITQFLMASATPMVGGHHCLWHCCFFPGNCSRTAQTSDNLHICFMASPLLSNVVIKSVLS